MQQGSPKTTIILTKIAFPDFLSILWNHCDWDTIGEIWTPENMTLGSHPSGRPIELIYQQELSAKSSY